jgi:hypothetical protein
MSDIVDELEAAKSAWSTALKSIEDAWKLLPDSIISNRSPVPRDLANQTLSHHGAKEMIAHLDAAIRSVKVSRSQYGRGPDPILDAQAVQTRWDSHGASEKRR